MSVSGVASPLEPIVKSTVDEVWGLLGDLGVDPPIEKPSYPVRVPGPSDLPTVDGLPAVPSPSPGPAVETHPGLEVGVGIHNAAELAQAEEMALNKPLVVRLRLRSNDTPARLQNVYDALELAHAGGHRTVLSLAYGNQEDGPAGFAAWVSAVINATADIPTSYEITNRVNGVAVDNRGDSSSWDSMDALIAGVVAARAANPAADIGFAWLSTGVDAVDGIFWTELRRNAPDDFAAMVDFVSTHIYPGTLGASSPWLVANGPRRLVARQLTTTRSDWMPMVGLSEARLEVGEFGFPVAYEPAPAYSEFPDVEQLLMNPNGQVMMLIEMAEGIRAAMRAADISLMTWSDLTDAPGCMDNRCWGVVDSSGVTRPAYDHLTFEVQRSYNASVSP